MGDSALGSEVITIEAEHHGAAPTLTDIARPTLLHTTELLDRSVWLVVSVLLVREIYVRFWQFSQC